MPAPRKQVQRRNMPELADRLNRLVSRVVEYLAEADDDPIDSAAGLVNSRPARDR
jgi:hypothetical protein